MYYYLIIKWSKNNFSKYDILNYFTDKKKAQKWFNWFKVYEPDWRYNLDLIKMKRNFSFAVTYLE